MRPLPSGTYCQSHSIWGIDMYTYIAKIAFPRIKETHVLLLRDVPTRVEAKIRAKDYAESQREKCGGGWLAELDVVEFNYKSNAAVIYSWNWDEE